jgi:lipoprotein signal peptidase
MKGNFNGLISGLVGWLLIALSGFILWLLYRVTHSLPLVYLAAAILFATLGVVLDRILVTYGAQRWPRLLS